MQLPFKAKHHIIIGTLLNIVFRPKLVNVRLNSCFLANLDFLLSHMPHFDDVIVLPLILYATFGFILSLCFCTLNNKITLFLYLRF